MRVYNPHYREIFTLRCISAAPKNFKYEQHNGKLVNVIKNNKGGDQAIFVDCDEDDGLQFFQIGAKALSPKLS